jgi:peptidyl-prolyl cis-trans isomerase C
MNLVPSRAAALTLLVLAASGCDLFRPSLKTLPVVKVNDAVLTAGEFSERLAVRLKSFNSLSAKDSTVVTMAKNAVVQEFIVQTVTQEWAQKNQVFVRKEALDDEINRIRKNYPDDIAFRKALADEGINFLDWEARLKDTLLERQVLAELRKNLPPPTGEAMRAYYDQHKDRYQLPAAVRIRQIVVDTEANAQRIKKEVDTGKSFAALAKKFSLTPEGENGGDLGWLERGSSDIFEGALKTAAPKRLQIVKSPYGYHLFEVTDKRAAKPLAFEAVKQRIERELLAQQEQSVYSTWLETQILQARVFKDDEVLKKIFVQSRGVQ